MIKFNNFILVFIFLVHYIHCGDDNSKVDTKNTTLSENNFQKNDDFNNLRKQKPDDRYFWQKSFNEFAKTNPGFIKKTVYKLINRTDNHKIIISTTVISSMIITCKFWLIPYIKKLVRDKEMVEEIQEFKKHKKKIDEEYSKTSALFGNPLKNSNLSWGVSYWKKNIKRLEKKIKKDIDEIKKIDEKLANNSGNIEGINKKTELKMEIEQLKRALNNCNDYLQIAEDELAFYQQLPERQKNSSKLWENKYEEIDLNTRFSILDESIIALYRNPVSTALSLGALGYLGLKIVDIYDILRNWNRGKHPEIEIIKAEEINVDIKNIGGLFLVKKSFDDLSNRINKIRGKSSAGYVLHGGPGTGKTLSAQYLAKKLGWYFMYVDSAAIMPTKESKYTISGAIKYIFEKAKDLEKCVILFDEFDRIFVENREIIPEILKLLDIYLKNENIIFIATTNYIDRFDPALLRSGRLSNVIFVDCPSEIERIDMIEKIIKSKKLNFHTINLKNYMAQITDEFSSAQIVDLINKINDKIKIKNLKYVTKALIDKAYFDCILGNKLSSINLSEENIKIISLIKAAELVYIEKNKELYPYQVILSTIKPYEKNFINKDDFIGYTYKINRLKNNIYLNETLLENELNSIVAKIVIEEFYSGGKSNFSKKNIEEAKNIIEKIAKIKNPFIEKSNQENSLEFFNEIYEKAYEKMKKFLIENEKVINEVSKALIENEFIVNDKLKSIVAK